MGNISWKFYKDGEEFDDVKKTGKSKSPDLKQQVLTLNKAESNDYQGS